MSKKDTVQESIDKILKEKTAASRPADKDDGDNTPGKLDAKGDPTASQIDVGGPTPKNADNKLDSANSGVKGQTPPRKADDRSKGDKSCELKGEAGTDPLPKGTVGDKETTDTNLKKNESKQETLPTVADEAIASLLGTEGITEEFKNKVKLVFETALQSKISSLKEQIEKEVEEAHKKALDEAVSAEISQIETTLDKFLSYVAEEWMKENKLVVEEGVKTEITESFINGLKDLFTSHFIDVPEDKIDVVEQLTKDTEDLNKKLQESEAKNADLFKQVIESKKEDILFTVAENLSDVQVDKLMEMAKFVEFVNEEDYKNKLTTLRDTLTAKKPEIKESVEIVEIKEDNNKETKVITGDMNIYVQALKK